MTRPPEQWVVSRKPALSEVERKLTFRLSEFRSRKLISVISLRLLRSPGAAFLIFLFLVSGNVRGQQPFVHNSDIQFKIRTDHRAYHIGDTIIIHYTIKNISNGSLYVPASQWEIKCGNNPHLWSLLEDSSGKHYEPGFAGSCLGPDPIDRMRVSERMKKDALLLRPGQVASGSFSFDSEVFAAGLKPGVYRLEALLYGWNQRFQDAQLSELAGMGSPFLIGESAASSTVELRIAER